MVHIFYIATHTCACFFVFDVFSGSAASLLFFAPQVQRAVLHWTGKVRLPPEQAHNAAFHKNYKVLQVLEKLQRLQVGTSMHSVTQTHRLQRATRVPCNARAVHREPCYGVAAFIRVELENSRTVESRR